MKRPPKWSMLAILVLVNVVRAEEAFRDDPVKNAATTKKTANSYIESTWRKERK